MCGEKKFMISFASRFELRTRPSGIMKCILERFMLIFMLITAWKPFL